ncbi:olfactory receptor 5V1-like [Rana temporaria]|uniref:olfactory receptor 5V1-like n=1 Tax=Rana temporaria TaxID=8407 RepID=UPI001AAC5760|nr:olfactory receptor 5V1-like [Rana temporaria]
MGNQTYHPDFTLLGLSDLTYSRIPLFLLFLLIYGATLAGNLSIVILVVTDSHLQTPMYFFLGNLAVLDIVTPSVSASQFPLYIFTGNRLILYSSCIAQVFFFSWFVVTEACLLAVMSYDRYVAICHPLHYTAMITFFLCVQLASSCWVIGSVCSLVHTLCTLRLTFCDSPTIPGLFCELYQLIQLSCSDTSLNYLLAYLQISSLGVAAFSVTFLSYFYVFKTILGIKMKDGRLKAFSTCSSHLMVVSIYYVTSFFNYFQPQAKNFQAGRLVSVVYNVFTPFLNPVLYSLRNSELKEALRRSLVRMGFRE